MRNFCILTVLCITMALYADATFGATPHLIRSIPADGATNVPLQQGKIVLFFDRNMKMNSWSLMQTDNHPFPPLEPIEEPWIDPLTFELKIKTLKPDTIYAIQLNSNKRKGFQAAEDQAPLPITTITFTTASAKDTAPAPAPVHTKGSSACGGQKPRGVQSASVPESGEQPGGQMLAGGDHSTDKHTPVYRYNLYEDTTEQAFTVLVPEGWQTQGGIMRLRPDQIRTVVDGCGKKLYFSVVDPASKAGVTYFPTDMYHTAAPGTSILPLAPGQVLNGMIQMMQVLSPSQYVQQVVFPFARSEATNVHWGNVKSLPKLAQAWNRAFHAEDPVPSRIVAESIEVQYDLAGTRFAELWTALITSVQANTSTVWMPDFVVAARSPANQVKKMAPLLHGITTSFRMNPRWLAQTIAHFNSCTRQVTATQEKIRAMEKKLSDRLLQVQKAIHKIDNEIVANRDSSRSAIQEHEFNTLMGQDKYEDTETGKRFLLDMGYERTFTNGEKIIQTNDWNYEMPPGFHEMKNVHITDE